MIHLVDIRRKFQQNPRSVYLPSDEDLAALGPGKDVELVIDNGKGGISASAPPSGERIWVRIKSRDGDSFTGTVNSQPIQIKECCFGDDMDFDLCHIISIYKRA